MSAEEIRLKCRWILPVEGAPIENALITLRGSSIVMLTWATAP
jgi:hypothetical protein